MSKDRSLHTLVHVQSPQDYNLSYSSTTIPVVERYRQSALVDFNSVNSQVTSSFSRFKAQGKFDQQ